MCVWIYKEEIPVIGCVSTIFSSSVASTFHMQVEYSAVNHTTSQELQGHCELQYKCSFIDDDKESFLGIMGFTVILK